MNKRFLMVGNYILKVIDFPICFQHTYSQSSARNQNLWFRWYDKHVKVKAIIDSTTSHFSIFRMVVAQHADELILQYVMKLRYVILLVYSISITVIFIKSKIDQIVNEIFDSDVVKVKVWYEGKKYVYDRQSRLVFIGGVPRSGTTMLRAMVEGHPSITCGEETGILVDLIKTFSIPLEQRSKTFLTVSGITENMIEDNVAEFVLKILTKHSRPNLLLCNKDPVVLNHTIYVHRLFPNSKFILIIRDGRATINSLIKNHILDHNMGPGITTFESGLMAWNFTMTNMIAECFYVGPQACMILYYELLVNEPEHWLMRVAKFLNVPYSGSMYDYRPLIGDKFDV
uniref:Protein-tyrosine sulfotransferase n=1 Tax=Romanomermis culicivorax TaxID=13658 RepID=A0A915KRC4_ROMCU